MVVARNLSLRSVFFQNAGRAQNSRKSKFGALANTVIQKKNGADWAYFGSFQRRSSCQKNIRGLSSPSTNWFALVFGY